MWKVAYLLCLDTVVVCATVLLAHSRMTRLLLHLQTANKKSEVRGNGKIGSTFSYRRPNTEQQELAKFFSVMVMLQVCIPEFWRCLV